MPKRNRSLALRIGDFRMQIQRYEKTLGPGNANDHGRGQRSLHSLNAAKIRWYGAWMGSKEFSKVWNNKSWCRKASLRNNMTDLMPLESCLA